MSGPTVGQVFSQTVAALAAAGIESARVDARLLLAEALSISPQQAMLYPERVADEESLARLSVLRARRCAQEPMAHILGRREFWSLSFTVSPATLIPRPDSETLIELAVASVSDREKERRVCDLGLGSGCLLFALLTEWPQAKGVGVDISSDALSVAKENARALGLSERARLIQGDWGQALAGPFDVLISNPPYIPSGDISGLALEVARYEPRLALDGGQDGLDAYRRIVLDAARLLTPGGQAFVEVGIGQAQSVAALFHKAGFIDIRIAPDLQGIERCVAARLRNA